MSRTPWPRFELGNPFGNKLYGDIPFQAYAVPGCATTAMGLWVDISFINIAYWGFGFSRRNRSIKMDLLLLEIVEHALVLVAVLVIMILAHHSSVPVLCRWAFASRLLAFCHIGLEWA